MENKKFVVIIQCELVHKKCSGFACTDSFYNRDEMFKSYKENTRYISFTCGGCCGKLVSGKLSHFSKKILKKTDYKKDEVIVHLASCMTSDNYHSDRCPHIDYIKDIIVKRGYDFLEGTYISKNAEIKREKGIYKTY
ncbi:MAG: CGGC domain-containing protein [Fusobacteriaceae bacterium]|jgi:predicted metal-binding protein|nr:CGGC domain-containing protein [Fusobacteriaceae bacterium]MBP9597270.1 CGGC domain-containing protein [Fusobacteriaceae bacterium]MBU9919174.1 CGGC domain-containing protein [Fusobacteriaceae bacterium]